ncbi:MAG: alpha/beta hydrolase [Lachnospiraceae bacterium]|nr:alpha/beta hydrolase [Ruminococcus sp.]MCM1276580.1 alpha/beta hydrolase [Lachnospiraceae bacterium]
MKYNFLTFLLSAVILLSGCGQSTAPETPSSENGTVSLDSADSSETSGSSAESADNVIAEENSFAESSASDIPEENPIAKPTEIDAALLTVGTENYRGFSVDNIYHSPNNGDIHFNLYVPESYDGSRLYALFVTLPGYEGLYFQGVAANIKAEEFGFEAQKYNAEMIVAAPQLSDWRETSANQTIALTEFLLENYNIGKVYANGFSGGGETLSLVLEKRPDLFAACLHISSQWDGGLQPVANARLPVYFAIGENDEYYGSQPAKSAYETLCGLYEKQGLTREEIEKLAVLDVKKHGYFTERGMSNEHGGGGLFAYDEEIMGWLFGH